MTNRELGKQCMWMKYYLWPANTEKKKDLDSKTSSNFIHLEDKSCQSKDWVNKGAVEGSLISAGMLAGKVSLEHAFPAGVGPPLPGQLSRALQTPNRTEGASTLPAPCILSA